MRQKTTLKTTLISNLPAAEWQHVAEALRSMQEDEELAAAIALSQMCSETTAPGAKMIDPTWGGFSREEWPQWRQTGRGSRHRKPKGSDLKNNDSNLKSKLCPYIFRHDGSIIADGCRYSARVCRFAHDAAELRGGGGGKPHNAKCALVRTHTAHPHTHSTAHTAHTAQGVLGQQQWWWWRGACACSARFELCARFLQV